jgi:hypothetical protein
MWGWAEKGRVAALLHASKIRLTVERCKGFRCSLTKNVLPAGFIRARCLSHAPMALSSSGRNGCVVENPCFNLTMCRTLPFVSTCSSFNRQASETRNPCRKIRSKRQRLRASLRVPRVAAISFPTSRPVKWSRPALLRVVFLFLAVFRCRTKFIFLSIVADLNNRQNPYKTPNAKVNPRQLYPFVEVPTTNAH